MSSRRRPVGTLHATSVQQEVNRKMSLVMTFYIGFMKQSMPALRQAVQDEVVYGLLRYHELVKPPTPPLEIRVQQALDEICPGLQSHNGNVELVAIKLPDTVEVK